MSEEKDSNEEEPNSVNFPNKENITIKKSSYNRLLITAVIAIVVAAFLGGYLVTTAENSDTYVKISDLEEILSKIDTKADTVQQTTPLRSGALILSVSVDDDPVKGSLNAPVTIIEFSDFQCPFCKRFADQTLPQIQQEYIDTGKVNFVYRDFPIDSIHPNARAAHVAAECADEQGKFWEYHDLLFKRQGQWSKLFAGDVTDELKQFASELGLELTSFGSCLDSPSFAEEVNNDYLEATRYGTTGTPTFFIGNEKDGFVKIVGAQPFVAFKQTIDQQLK